MFCPRCSAQLPDNSQFCGVCGAQLNAPNVGNPYASAPGQYGYGAPNPQITSIPDYLVWNILGTILCCLPIGIGGIIASARTSGAKNRGDYEAAIRSSSTAKTYMIVNIVLSAILIVLYVLAAVANEM